MEDFILNIKDKSRVVVGESAKLIDGYLKDKGRIVVVTDTNIDRIYGARFAQYEKILIGVGESSKTMLTVESICRQLIELSADRSVFLLGVGGGIVSDITGFVAAIYMRGVKFGFISTTLLSQVDAGVGGKNGVNLDGYKNMIGTFLQPEFVICDTAMLPSLSDREFRAGVAEIIKSAIITNSELFELLESNDVESLRANPEVLAQIIFESIKIKAKIVDMDEREAGERKKLNLGHTFAHAIEKNSREMNHGEAVAVGLVLISKIALHMELISEAQVDRIEKILLRYGFVIESPVPMPKMLSSITHDKKADGDRVAMVFPTSIGSCIVKKMTVSQLKEIQAK